MLTLGSPAPSFDCSAVVDHEVVELNWNQVYERRTLVLQFDSIENYTALPDDLVALSSSVGDFERLHPVNDWREYGDRKQMPSVGRT